MTVMAIDTTFGITHDGSTKSHFITRRLFGFRSLVERFFVAHPWHVNARGDFLGPPLNAAIYNGDLNIALALLERAADVESRGWKGQTALYMASSPGYTEIVRSLIERDADTNTECDDWTNYEVVKWTALHVASRNGRPVITRLLLEHGAVVNYEDKFGKNALHLASRHRSNDLARLLLDHGANLNALDTWGETALHRASFHGRIEVVTLLLEYGANVDDRSNLARTPLHCAADAGHPEIVEVLQDHDADVNAPVENLPDCVALGSVQWVPAGCDCLTQAWHRSTCPD
jgi:ankyrin repeat protein